MSNPETRPRRRGRRILLIVLGSIALLILLALALAPTIGGAIAPGIIQGAARKSIAGDVSVKSVSLSWFGKQRLGTITVTGADGQPIGVFDVEASRGLFGLATGAAGGSLNLGEVKLSGKATIIRGKDGSTNIEKLIKPAAAAPPAAPSGGGPAKSEPAKLPKGLAGRITVDALDVTYADESSAGKGFASKAFKLDASITGGKATVVLSVPMSSGADGKSGSLSVDAKVDGFADASGLLTPDAATIDASIVAKDLPIAVADALAGMDNRLVAAVGETLQASIHAKGKLRDGEAAITVSSKGLNADLAFKTTGGVLTNSKPGKLTLATSGMLPLVPDVERSLKQQDAVKFDKLPDVTLNLDGVKFTMPAAGKQPDLRTAGFVLTAETTGVEGSVKLAGDAVAKPYRVEPLKATIDARDLNGGVAVQAKTTAMLDGKAAGDLVIDASARELLDGAGSVRPGMPSRLDGTVSLTGFMTAIAQPFVAAAGVDLNTDVGPRLDLVAKASASPDPKASASAIPPTRLSLDVKSANINAAVKAQVDGGVLSADGNAVEVKVGALGPLLTRTLKDSGVSVESGMGLTLTVSDVHANLDEISKKEAASPDLRSVKALVRVETTAAAGQIATPGQPVRAIQLAPLIATVDAKDLAKAATVNATTSITLDGQPAGDVKVDLAATNVLAASGSLSPGAPPIGGQVSLTNIAMAVAQPWVEAAGLDLPGGVGPKLDVVLTAAPVKGAPAGGDIPATDLEVKIKSAGLAGSVLATLDGSMIRTRGNGVEFSLRSPGTLAGKAVQKSGVVVSSGGYAKVSVKDLAWSMKGGTPLDSAAALVEVNIGGFSVAPVPGQGAVPDPVSINQFIIGAKLTPGAAPSVTLKGSGGHTGGNFFAQGALDLPGLFTKSGAITPRDVRPLGSIQFNNIPTSLAAFGAGAPKPGGLDIVKLTRDAVGKDATVTFNSAAKAGSVASARDVKLAVVSEHFNGDMVANVDDTQLALSKLDFRTVIGPELAGTLFDMIGSQLESKPVLSGPATLAISAEPFVIPMQGLEPHLARAGDASIKVGLEGKTLINNIAFKNEAGVRKDIGTIGLQDILVKAKVPLASLAKGGATKPAEAILTGIVLGSADQKVVELSGEAQANLSEGKPVGDASGALSLSITDAKRLDTILDKPGLVSGAVGDSLKLTSSARVKLPKDATETINGAAIELALTSPRISTTKPLKATATKDVLAIDSPMELVWNVDPVWVNMYALAPAPPQPAQPGKPAAKPNPNPLKIAGPTSVTVLLSKLTLAMNDTPMKPGVFAADAEIKSAALPLSAGKNAATFKNFAVRMTGGREPGVVGFSVRADDLGGGVGPSGGQALVLQGGVYKLADANGKITSDTAVLSMTGDAFGVPTAIVDAVAQQGGVLAEALGPTVTVNIKTEGVNKTRGNLVARATSSRADAEFKGSIIGGTFVADGPANIALKVITPDLGKMMVDGLPFIGSFEKRSEDGPAIIKATALKVPVDGQMQKLNGDVVVDVGTARFATSKVFGTLLKLTGQKESGEIGRKLEPLAINIKDGVATYQRWKLPVGQFNVDTRGTVDLVNKNLDVITYIPFGALTDEAAGKLNTGLGGLLAGAVPLLEQATMVPFRTKGTFENPKTEADLQLMVKEAGKTLLRPDKLLKNGLQDVFKKKDGK